MSDSYADLEVEITRMRRDHQHRLPGYIRSLVDLESVHLSRNLLASLQYTWTGITFMVVRQSCQSVQR